MPDLTDKAITVWSTDDIKDEVKIVPDLTDVAITVWSTDDIKGEVKIVPDLTDIAVPVVHATGGGNIRRRHLSVAEGS